LASLDGPVLFVSLIAVQQVVLQCSLFDCFLNGETHGDEADARFGKAWIETGLIEVEGSAIQESIECRDRSAVQPQNVQSEPAAIERDPAHLPVEGKQFRGMESVRTAALPPAHMVQANDQVDGLAPLLLGARLLEFDFEFLRQPAEFPAEVVAVLGSQLGQIGLPGESREWDERADIGPRLRNTPAAFAQHLTDVSRKTSLPVELRQAQEEPFRG